MIDLHCHLLPGIDDGSKNMETSLNLARAAVADGIQYALMTPHHMNGEYVNHKADVLVATEQFQTALKENSIDLTVFPGQEVRINGDLPAALDNDDILFTDPDDQYLLLEFPDNDVPTYTTDMVFKLQMRGIIPVIVHPERNTKILDQPEILMQLLEKGCLSQVTASSYVGTFGKKVEEFSHNLIANGQAYIFASDAHDLPGRKYEMGAAFKKLRKEFGDDVADEFEANAKAMINGDPIATHILKDMKPKKKKKRFRLF